MLKAFSRPVIQMWKLGTLFSCLFIVLLIIAIKLPVLQGWKSERPKLTQTHLFQALAELSHVERPGILTVDATPIFVQHVTGQQYSTIVAELKKFGINRPPNATPPTGKIGWLRFEDNELRLMPGNHFKRHDRVAVAFKLLKGQVEVTETTWLNTTASP